MKRWLCGQCESIVADDTLLSATNPFDPTETIYGCPRCLGVGGFTLLCDVDGCEAKASCGFPTVKGYRQTCGQHYQKEQP